MDGWTIGLWGVGGFIAVAALAKIMTARRNQVLQEWQAKVPPKNDRRSRSSNEHVRSSYEA